MKLARKCFAQYLDSTFDVTKSSPAWFLVGKNVDEMSTELNPDVTVGQDVTGENYTEDNGYTPSVEVDPYYANPSDGAFYEKLVDIAMNRKVDDSCRTFIMEVLVEDTEAETHKAWMEEVIVKPKSIGGKANVSIPYTVNYSGNRVEGTVTIKNKVPTFTAKTALPA